LYSAGLESVLPGNHGQAIVTLLFRNRTRLVGRQEGDAHKSSAVRLIGRVDLGLKEWTAS
jgi:hypothetical protein